MTHALSVLPLWLLGANLVVVAQSCFLCWLLCQNQQLLRHRRRLQRRLSISWLCQQGRISRAVSVSPPWIVAFAWRSTAQRASVSPSGWCRADRPLSLLYGWFARQQQLHEGLAADVTALCDDAPLAMEYLPLCAGSRSALFVMRMEVHHA
jgi:hypothetical protein